MALKEATALLLVATVGMGCQKSPPPAAPAVSVQGGEHVDLKTAMTRVLPDFRNARVFHVQAGLWRELSPVGKSPAPFKTQLELYALEMGFAPTRTDAGSDLWATRPPYTLVLEPAERGVRMELRLLLSPDDLNALLHSPSPMTTEHLAAQLPVPKFARLRAPAEFYFEVHYEETSRSGDFLVRQTFRWLRAHGYRGAPNLTDAPDAGIQMTWPTQFEATLVNSDAHARVEALRNEREYRLRWIQTLPGERP